MYIYRGACRRTVHRSLNPSLMVRFIRYRLDIEYRHQFVGFFFFFYLLYSIVFFGPAASCVPHVKTFKHQSHYNCHEELWTHETFTSFFSCTVCWNRIFQLLVFFFSLVVYSHFSFIFIVIDVRKLRCIGFNFILDISVIQIIDCFLNALTAKKKKKIQLFLKTTTYFFIRIWHFFI